MEEQWKTLTEEGLNHYQVSNLGRVRRLERQVPVHLYNHGKHLTATAHRKEKIIKVQMDGGRPIVRLSTDQGQKKKRTLPLLVLQYFGEPCPGLSKDYTSGHKDGDITNNVISNLEWVSRAKLASNVGLSRKGIPNTRLIKHHNIVLYLKGQPIQIYNTIKDIALDFKENNIPGAYDVILRHLNDKTPLYDVFTFVEVNDSSIEQIKKDIDVPFHLDFLWDLLNTSLDGRKIIDSKTIRKLKRELKETKERLAQLEADPIPEPVKKPVKQKKPVSKPKKESLIKSKDLSKLDDIDDSAFYREQEKLEAEKKEEFIGKLLRAIKNKS